MMKSGLVGLSDGGMKLTSQGVATAMKMSANVVARSHAPIMLDVRGSINRFERRLKRCCTSSTVFSRGGGTGFFIIARSRS